jgi:spermidine/putrescine transport system ATP-binding protein
MNSGHIEQMGAPAELYDLPRTAFVANFVGQSNLGSGQVVDRDGRHVVAHVQGTKVKIPVARSAVTSGEVTFGVRPEKVRVLRAAPEGTGDDVRGTVLDVSFTGVATTYLVRLPSGAVWSCYEQNLDVEPVDLRPGDDVWITWDPHHAFGVAVDEAQARAAAEAV